MFPRLYFSRPDFAEAGRLLVVDAVDHSMRLIDAVGRRTLDYCAVASIDNVVILSGNVTIALAIQGLAETFALVRELGGDPAPDSLGMPIPTTSVMRKMHRAATAPGHGGVDWGGLDKFSADMAGDT